MQYHNLQLLGAEEDQLSPSELSLVKNTAYDDTFKAMYKAIEDKISGFNLFKRLKYLDFMGGGIKKFLTNYINLAASTQKAYDPNNLKAWMGLYRENYGKHLDNDELTMYFTTFGELALRGSIPKIVVAPWKYKRDFDKNIFGFNTDDLPKYAIIAGASYLFLIHGLPVMLRNFTKK